MLHIRQIIYKIDQTTLFDGASATIDKGHRVALIGRNGAGKSTLLRMIARHLEPDEGDIEITGGLRAGLLAQHAPSGRQSVRDTVMAADRERTRLLAQAETETDPHAIAAVQTRLADIGAHSAEARAARLLHGLGFDQAAQARPLDEYSGGWRMRVALAAILFAEPDLLLLDEPSNHLDLEATIWLGNYLARWPHTLLMVSHDRNFINTVATDTLHLAQKTLTLYRGNYDMFERVERERREHQTHLARQQAARKRDMQRFVDRFRAKATKARQAQSRIKALARMTETPPPAPEPSVRFTFPAPARYSPPPLRLEAVAAGYEPDKPVLRALDLQIDEDDRIALLGANGNGKTTLLRLLAGRLPALGGHRRAAHGLTVGYYAQDQNDRLSVEATPLELLAAEQPDWLDTRLRTYLGGFGFSGPHAEIPVGSLSGGERARLQFALISAHSPQILLLDEPTNHLDIMARAALIEAINAFAGAVVLVTHDQQLIELCTDRLWIVAGGTCRPFDDDLAAYRTQLLAAEARGAATDTPRPAGGSRKQLRRAAADARLKTAPLRRKVQAAEAEVERLGREKADIERQLADPSLYSGTATQVTELTRAQSRVARELAAAEAAWLEATEALEGAEPE